MYEKSSRLSAAHREKGNESYGKGEFFEALVCYNKALAFAESIKDLSLAYANRSAVYIEVKKYDECLENIKWARENQYPKEKLEKLKDREEKCKNQKKANDKEVKESFFKLSYAPNPKIPFIVENLYTKYTKEFGRGVYAATDLKAGDVIAIESPTIAILHENDDSRYKHCCNCMSSRMLNLLPCFHAAAVMFCSDNCRNEIYRCFLVNKPANMFIPANRELISRDIVMSFFSKFFKDVDEFVEYARHFDSKNYNKSVFDLDFSDPTDKDYKMNLLHCFLAFESKNEETVLNIKTGPLALASQLLNHFTNILDFNRIVMRYQEQNVMNMQTHGSAVSLFGSLINHSCDHNIYGIIVDNKFAFVVRKPIAVNEQLFINYDGTFFSNPNVVDRRQNLRRFNFICQCDACNNNDAYNEKFDNSNVPSQNKDSPVDRPTPKSYEEAVNEINENCKVIEDKAGITWMNCMLMGRNFDLLNFLGKFEAFPQKI